MRVFLSIFFTAACLAAGTDPIAAQETRKPNVIILLADDLGYGDLGFQGCKDIPTPNLDALARSGARCTDAYVSAPVCSPTRAGLLTGRYQQRFGFEFNGGGKVTGLPVAEKTLADLLHAAGYVTGAIGKWHLGLGPEFHPLVRGFDEFFGFLTGGRSFLPLEDSSKTPLVRGRTTVPEPAYLTDAFAEEAVQFIERHRRKPFFLYVAFNAVHVPLEATEKYLNRFPDIPQKGRRTYAAMLSAMDDAVGQIVRKLRESGLERDTLIVFLSDNGGHPLANAARNGRLRGEKSTLHEGGVRVPFVVSWPARIPAGSTYGQPVISLDIVPTSLAAAGARAPAGVALDGVDIVPHLTGKVMASPHDVLYWRYGDHHAVRQGRWKLTVPAHEPRGLYDLVDDIGETKDRSADQPERLRELTRRYDEWSRTLPNPL